MLIWPHVIGLPALGYTASTRRTLRKHFVAAWGKTEIFASRAVSWDLTRIKGWTHTEGWSIRYAQRFQNPYGLRLAAACRNPYGEMLRHRRHVVAAYGDMSCNTGWFVVRYDDLSACRKSMRLVYWLTREVHARHVPGYSVRTVDPVARGLTASWSLLDDARLQAVSNTPELVWADRTIRIVQATLSCDEDSPVWIAQVEIAALADFASIGIGDEIRLSLGLETFVLVVDGKTLSRESLAEQRCELSAVSPLALRDSPFAGSTRYTHPEPLSARIAVEQLIGPVDWQVRDWIIPAGRLMLENVTPLAGARAIIAAIGGIVESNPDGSVICRRRHPVSIPDYAQEVVAHSLFDADVISAQARIAPMRGFNRVTIANEDAGSNASSDRIEYVADDDDPYRGTVRVYLATSLASARTVVLAHTGHPATVIDTLGERTRVETETVEFVEGRASTRYPVTAIVDLAWQHTGLGEVTASGQNLTAAVSAYSLLRITYTTTSLDWRVALPVDEEVQFVLVDA